MRGVFFPGLVAAILTGTVPVLSQDNKEAWVRLDIAGTDISSGEVTLRLSENVPRIRALKLAASGYPLAFTRVSVAYSNGQMHFEERPISLQRGQQSGPIDERGEARHVNAIGLKPVNASDISRHAEVEIWGLRVENQAAGPKNRGTGDRYAEIPVFYGTIRKREKDRVSESQRLAAFSGELGSNLLFGRAVVTVPLERMPGSISRPIVIARIALRNEDRNRDFTLASVDVVDKESFVAELKKKLASSSRYKRQAFVFVHGYNVSFDDAIFRTAQIAHDIHFDGPAITFTWPSRGGMWDYVHDINTAKASRESLRTFLETVARDADADSVNLIAHSMGNDPVIEVLRLEAEVAARGGRKSDFRLNEVILAAPDVSRSVFEQFAGQFASLVKGGVTLYASRRDLALTASKKVSSGIVRAGDIAKEGILIVPGIESIDISDASTSVLSLNHSTFAEREHLVTDVRFLFERSSNKHPPDVRYGVYRASGLQPKLWWQYRKQ